MARVDCSPGRAHLRVNEALLDYFATVKDGRKEGQPRLEDIRKFRAGSRAVHAYQVLYAVPSKGEIVAEFECTSSMPTLV